MNSPHTAAAQRVLAFLDRRATMRMLDPEIIHGLDGLDYSLTTSDLRTLATFAPVAPTQPTRVERKIYKGTPEHREYLSARFPYDGSSKSNSFEWQGHRWAYQHTFFNDAGDYDLIYRNVAEAAPVAPAPLPTKRGLEKLKEWEKSGELLQRAWNLLYEQEQEIMRLEQTLAAAPKAAPQPARLMFPNPVDIFSAMSDTAKARTSPENVADVLMALAAAGMQTKPAPPKQWVTDKELRCGE